MKGQTLIEVLVALGTAVIVITAITTVVLSSLNNSKVSNSTNLATQYAQEGMEDLHQIRDNNYAAFAGYNGTYCLSNATNPPTLTAPCSMTTTNVGSFLRTAVISQNGCGSNIAQITVSVGWSDSKCSSPTSFCHSSQLVSCLSTVGRIVGP